MEQEAEIKIETSESPESKHSKDIKSRRVLKSLKEKDSNYKFYGWDLMENYTYITYLTNFRHIFDSHIERKRIKVFRHLSKLIKTRNPHQIKSHHQKMMLRHQNVDTIIDFIRNKITKEIASKPEYVQIIRRLNMEAEIFFLKEQGLSALKSLQEKTKTVILRSHLPPAKGEMAEEGPQDHLRGVVKEEAEPPIVLRSACLKEEEERDNLIWHKEN